jgi:hypothetical protein
MQLAAGLDPLPASRAFAEPDLADTPAFLRRHGPLIAASVARIAERHEARQESLLAVDRHSRRPLLHETGGRRYIPARDHDAAASVRAAIHRVLRPAGALPWQGLWQADGNPAGCPWPGAPLAPRGGAPPEEASYAAAGRGPFTGSGSRERRSSSECTTRSALSS